MLEHRYWCQVCRKVRAIVSEATPEQAKAKSETCHCHAMVTYLESVSAPASAVAAAGGASAVRRPPSAQEWYDSGYAAGTYRTRFADDPTWGAPWSDPTYVSKRRTADEIAECMANDGLDEEEAESDETEQAPPVGESVDVDD